MLACVSLPLLPIQVERRRLNFSGPLLLAQDGKVYAASEEALAAGVFPAMRLYQAQQTMPDAHFLDADEATYHDCHEAVASALAQFNPQIETVVLGEFLIDVSGLASFTGGYAALAQAIQKAAVEVSSLRVHVGLAATRFAAQQAARHPNDDGTRVLAAGQEAAFVAPLSVTMLPGLDLDTTGRLQRLGLTTVGQFSMLPVQAVARQFGADVKPQHEMARGRDRPHINPDVPPLRDHRGRNFDEPLYDRRAMTQVAVALAAELGESLSRRGYHAETLQLKLTYPSSPALTASYVLKPPTADPARLTRRVRDALQALRLTGPVCAIDLTTYPLRPWHIGATQMDLFTNVSSKKMQIGPALASLARRFGAEAVTLASRLAGPAPVPVQVVETATGAPRVLIGASRRQSVMQVIEHWQLEGDWWDVPTCRDYFRVLLDDGSVKHLYRESGDGGPWFADRSIPLL